MKKQPTNDEMSKPPPRNRNGSRATRAPARSRSASAVAATPPARDAPSAIAATPPARDAPSAVAASPPARDAWDAPSTSAATPPARDAPPPAAPADAPPPTWWWEDDASAVQHDDALLLVCRHARAPLPPRVLALHGFDGGVERTNAQLRELGLDGKLDVVHLRGPLATGRGHGWWPADAPPEAVARCLRGVLRFVEARGPFVALYGFGQGAAVAAAASATGCAETLGCAPRSWEWVVCACAATAGLEAANDAIQRLRGKAAGLHLFRPGAIVMPSLHVLGMRDHAHRDEGVKLSRAFAHATNVFHDGAHEIPPRDRRDALFRETLAAFVVCPFMA